MQKLRNLYLSHSFLARSLQTVFAENGKEALDIVENEKHINGILLDLVMPVMDGFDFVEEMREFKDIPVIMLTAKSQSKDKLRGFSLGIDDYVTKPFSPKELIARIKAVTKRYKNDEDVIKVGAIVINNLSHEVYVDNQRIEVTHTQFELLTLFLTNQNIALSRDRIIEAIWGYEYEGEDRTIDAHIKLLRSKLGKYRNSIKTIRKVGYKFEYVCEE